MDSEHDNYIVRGTGKPMLLLHGLFGGLSNWESVLNRFSQQFRVIIPRLPIYEGPKEYTSIMGLLKYVEKFIKQHALRDLTLVGNSLGGHLVMLYALHHPKNVRKMILTGSSGLFENTLGGSFPRRGSYEYIKERVLYTFYNPNTVSEALIQEVFRITRNISMCLRVVAIAKSAQRHNLSKELRKIATPTLLVWGLNDTITPPAVAHEFHHKLQNATLHFIDKCCHVPMMEHPDHFNRLVADFIEKEPSVSL